MSTLIIEAALAQYEVIRKHEAGEVIFREGDVPRGVYVLRSGSVDLTFASPHGEVRHPRVALPGQILGLSAVVMRHRLHEVTATSRTACEIGFIESAVFERALAENPAVWFAVLHILSNEVNDSYNDLRLLTGVRRERRPDAHSAATH